MRLSLENARLKRAIQRITPNAVNLVAPKLIKDVLKNGVDLKADDHLFTLKEMKVVERQILKKLREMDRVRKLPYHNANHTANVLYRIRKLASKAKLEYHHLQLLELAALFHDYEHGSPIYNSRNGRLTYEERSAIEADAFIKANGLSIKQRLLIYGLIIGTTFSNPSIRPRTRLEKMLVIADLGGFINTSREWLLESLHVTQEIPPRHRPNDVKEWLREQQIFLNYAKTRLTPEAKELSWNKSLDRKSILLKKLLFNPEYNKTYTPLVKKIKRALVSAV